ncbi:MAG: hypothetical protein ACOY82_18315 [Pseudomonadota bacterium]
MQQKQRQGRLVSSYLISDPVVWANAYLSQADRFANAGIKVVRAKVKAHPRRHSDFPYRVSLTFKIDPAKKDVAMQILQSGRGLMKKGGVDAASIVNDWYP